MGGYTNDIGDSSGFDAGAIGSLDIAAAPDRAIALAATSEAGAASCTEVP